MPLRGASPTLAGGPLRKGPFSISPPTPRVKAGCRSPHLPRTLSCMEWALKAPTYTSTVGGVGPGQWWAHFSKGFKAAASRGGGVSPRGPWDRQATATSAGTRLIQVSAVDIRQHLPWAPQRGAGRPQHRLLQGPAEGVGCQPRFQAFTQGVQDARGSPFLRSHFSYISSPGGFSADREAPYPAGNAV